MTPPATVRQIPTTVLVVYFAGAVGCLVMGAVTFWEGAAPRLPDHFRVGELLGWLFLAVVTGGVGIGTRRTRNSVVASGLVGSAALLGASPIECALIGAAGALGGLIHVRGDGPLRVAGAAVVGWAAPSVLAWAALLGGRDLGPYDVPVASLVALWFVLAIVVPIVEALGTKLTLPPEDQVDPVHMLQRRLEPQSVIAALAALAAVTYAEVGAWAGLLVLLPALSARTGFLLLEEGRRAVSQTLAAMTILPEWVGIVDPGHTSRVCDVVEQVTVDLDLESRVRWDIVRAAELHELGHLDSGVVQGDRGRIARGSAAVVEQAGMRHRVVQILDATDPERPMGSPDPDVELGAAILSAACELDRMGAIAEVSEAATRIKIALGKAHRSASAYL